MSSRQADGIRADVAVVGSGPAGIAAAALVAESGRRVVLLDESPAVGGEVWRHRPGHAPPAAARRWIARLEQSGATILSGASVVDVHSGGAERFVVLAEHGFLPCVVHASSLVLATGARERFLPFPGWTLPGVFGVGGASALLESGLSFAGKRVVVAGSGPLLLPVAAALSHGGARLQLVAEQADRGSVVRFATTLWRRPALLAQAARYRARFLRTPYRAGTWVVSARGDGRVEEATVTDGRVERTIACDALCAAYGLVPDLQLPRLLGCEIADDAVKVDDRQQTSVPRVYAAGEATGVGGAELALVEGELAARAIIGSAMGERRLHRRREALREASRAMARAFAPRDELRRVVRPDTIVCRCEDVAAGALGAFTSARQAKLYTRAGMGACQGRVCGTACAFLYGWPADRVRAPVKPTLLSTVLAEGADGPGAPR